MGPKPKLQLQLFASPIAGRSLMGKALALHCGLAPIIPNLEFRQAELKYPRCKDLQRAVVHSAATTVGHIPSHPHSLKLCPLVAEVTIAKLSSSLSHSLKQKPRPEQAHMVPIPIPPEKRGWCRCNCKGTGAQEQLNKQESKINNRKSLRHVSRIENDNDKMRKNKYQTKVISMQTKKSKKYT
ncbi:LOW QUALITY PROTEIN: uncharacterized protein Dsimw501_GD29272 [Drosophila simulans]|uniref:Uncharacterized protein n=1 Tax=Drosophila simulans TaxID=7240 RepID=A0A0J9RX96_DROSI|nr:LOW QUALITY PROTEIN: uncharacterized protein Dsimw501_GD29272 [Drosophila simulans]